MQVQETNYLRDITIVNRVCMGPEKPGKSQNFLLTFSRTGESQKRPQVLESPRKPLTCNSSYKVFRPEGEFI